MIHLHPPPCQPWSSNPRSSTVISRRFLDANKHRDASLSDRLDMFFYDADLMPLLFQENFLKTKITLPPAEKAYRADWHTISRAADAADCVSEADTVNNSIRKSQQWGLLPLYGLLSTIKAGLPVRGIPPTFFGNEVWRRQSFTKALGFMSTMNKKNRLVADIERCMKAVTTANKTEVRAAAQAECGHQGG